MEALGRLMAVLTAAVSLVLFLFFYQSASVKWQKNETVYSIGKAYAENILYTKTVLDTDWKRFQEKLNRLGEYETELTIYERKRYEGDNGRVYLFEEWGGPGEKELSAGSYVRLVVREKPRGKLAVFLYGGGCTVIAGGRIA